MLPIILDAKLLTPELEIAVMQVPYTEIDPDVIVHGGPVIEEDPSAPIRSYVVAVPVEDGAAFVGIHAAPAPVQAPTIAELKAIADAVVFGED